MSINLLLLEFRQWSKKDKFLLKLWEFKLKSKVGRDAFFAILRDIKENLEILEKMSVGRSALTTQFKKLKKRMMIITPEKHHLVYKARKVAWTTTRFSLLNLFVSHTLLVSKRLPDIITLFLQLPLISLNGLKILPTIPLLKKISFQKYFTPKTSCLTHS